MKAQEFKKIFFYSKSIWLYVALFIVVVANLVYSAYLHRPMYHEGAEWYFKILQFRKYFFDNQHYRYFDILIQLPAYFYQYFFEPDSPKPVITLLDISYTFHPFLSLLLCTYLLQKYNRMELVIFPILSFFVLSLPASLFAVSNGAQILTVFWPLFLILLIPEKPTISNFILVLTLTLFLAFIHQATMFVILILLVTAWQKRASHIIYYFYSLLLCLSFLAQIYFFAEAIQYNRLGSILADFKDINLFHGLTALIVILFFMLITSSLVSTKKSLIYGFSLVLVILMGSYLVYFFNPYDFYFSRISRAFTAPFGALIALLVLLIQTKYSANWRRVLSTKSTWLPIFFTFTSIIILYTFVDISNTLAWKKETTAFKKLLLNRKGCFLLNQKESYRFSGAYAGLPYFSILFQEKKDIEVILMNGYYSPEVRLPLGPIFCGVGPDKIFFSNERVPIDIEDGLYFNFKKVFDHDSPL